MRAGIGAVMAISDLFHVILGFLSTGEVWGVRGTNSVCHRGVLAHHWCDIDTVVRSGRVALWQRAFPRAWAISLDVSRLSTITSGRSIVFPQLDWSVLHADLDVTSMLGPCVMQQSNKQYGWFQRPGLAAHSFRILTGADRSRGDVQQLLTASVASAVEPVYIDLDGRMVDLTRTREQHHPSDCAPDFPFQLLSTYVLLDPVRLPEPQLRRAFMSRTLVLRSSALVTAFSTMPRGLRPRR